MGEMASRGKAQAQECVAGRHQGHERRRIGGSPGMRLDVCELTSKKPCNPLYCNGFHLVDKLASAIVAPPRQAFGVFIGENRALGFQNCGADKVFRCNQLDLVALAV